MDALTEKTKALKEELAVILSRTDYLVKRLQPGGIRVQLETAQSHLQLVEDRLSAMTEEESKLVIA